MKSKPQSIRFLLLPIMLLAATAFTGCFQEADPAVEVKKEKRVARVKTMVIEPELFSQRITLTATAKAGKEVDVAAEIAGRVKKVGFEKGDEVAEGTPILWLDDAKMEADLKQVMASRDLAQLDYDKYKALVERQAAVSPFELERARLKLIAAEASYESLSVAKNKNIIKAPISGQIVNRNTEKGAIVRPGAPIARIVSIRPIKISFGVPEAAIADFSIGKKAEVIFDAYPGQKFAGAITFVSPEVNRRARTFEGELELGNENGKIFPGMSAKVTFTRKELTGSILIPQTAILELSDGHAVFLVDEGGIARQRRITIDDYSNEKALIGSGLVVSERLVIIGHRSLLDGDAVEEVVE